MVATAVATAFGRAGSGIEAATSSRYTTFSAVFWVALIGACWRMSDVKSPRARTLQVLVASWAAILLALSYLAWFLVGQDLRQRTAAMDLLAKELQAGQFVPQHMAQIHPRPEVLRNRVEFLRAHKLSIFAD